MQATRARTGDAQATRAYYISVEAITPILRSSSGVRTYEGGVPGPTSVSEEGADTYTRASHVHPHMRTYKSEAASNKLIRRSHYTPILIRTYTYARMSTYNVANK